MVKIYMLTDKRFKLKGLTFKLSSLIEKFLTNAYSALRAGKTVRVNADNSSTEELDVPLDSLKEIILDNFDNTVELTANMIEPIEKNLSHEEIIYAIENANPKTVLEIFQDFFSNTEITSVTSEIFFAITQTFNKSTNSKSEKNTDSKKTKK